MLVFIVSLLALGLSVEAGRWFASRRAKLDEPERHDLDLILTASLTLLGLIIGFSFSMSITRYDQRKNYEEEEANAIGTEYARMGLLPAADAAKGRELLRHYLELRIQFYDATESARLHRINAETDIVQKQMWSVVQAAAVAQPTPVVALSVAGMNDVLNSQGYTQAAWWNRLPQAAWALLAIIAACCNFVFGFSAHHTKRTFPVVLPLIIAISFALIADLDSPRGGLIRVSHRNLVSASGSLAASWP